MRFVAQETDLAVFFAVAVATLCLALLVQVTVRLFNFLGASLRWIRWRALGALCVAVLFALSLRTGLTMYLTILAMMIALITRVGSRPRAMTAFLVTFALLTMAVPLLSGVVHVNISPMKGGPHWVSKYSGQVALWPRSTRASSSASVDLQYLLVVYDDVRLTRLPCHRENGSVILNEKNAVARDPDRPSEDNEHFAEMLPEALTRFIVSLAEQCTVRALGGCDERGGAVVHRLSLLGTSNRLEGVTVRCRLSNKVGNTCLYLSPDTLFRKVRVEVYASRNNGGSFLTAQDISHADGCAAIEQQVRQMELLPSLLPQVLRCLPLETINNLPRLVRNHQIVPAVLAAHIPRVVYWRSQMPHVLHVVRCLLTFTREYVFVPLSAWSAVAVSQLSRILADVVVILHGAVCAATSPKRRMGFCHNFDDHYKSDGRFRWGARASRTTWNVCAWLADALDVFPGLSAAYAWAWRAEWEMTRWTLRSITHSTTWTTAHVALPAAKGTKTLLQWSGGLLAPMYDVLSPLITKSFAALGPLVLYLWELELHILAVEKRWLWHVMCSMWKNFLVVLAGMMRAAVRLLKWTRSILLLYSATTLSAHMFVVLLQTMLLLVGIRNELRELSALEMEQYPSFMRRFMGNGLLMKITTFLRVHSSASVRYFFTHFLMFFVLIGLSVLRLMAKWYNLTLYLIFPYVSSDAFLLFFSKTPRRSNVILMSIAKGVAVVVVDHTIGSFASYMMRELFIGSLCILIPVSAHFVWRNGIHATIWNTLRTVAGILTQETRDNHMADNNSNPVEQVAEKEIERTEETLSQNVIQEDGVDAVDDEETLSNT